MKFFTPRLRALLMVALLVASRFSAEAKSYSSGGHSYSSHSSSSHSTSSSHSSSSGHSGSTSHSSSSSSHTFSSGGSSSHSSTSGSSSKSFSSSSGHSYSSGSSHDDSSRRSYSSGKSYSSSSDSLFSSSPKRSTSSSSTSSRPRSSSDDLTFDSAAARARKEEASKDTFTQYKESQAPKPARDDFSTTRSTPPVIPTTSTTSYRRYRQTVYIPDATVLSTRSIRIETVFQPYYMRPIVRYRDPYSSLFWWWLLDRSLDDRATWAYNHRADMDAARYQALLEQDAQLEARVQQLEAQQTAVDPDYVPTGLDRDLMYSDEHLQHNYSTRPTTGGSIAFWIFGGIMVFCVGYFFVWLVFFHRWQVQPST